MKTKITLLAILIMSIAGCSSVKKNSSKEATKAITEKYWKLITLDGKAITAKENQEREIFITLNAKEKRVTGFAGCNNLSGEYTLEDGNRIRFKNVAVTMKICPDLDVNESDFLEIFELADNYTINDNVLSLNVGRRAPLAVFEAVTIK